MTRRIPPDDAGQREGAGQLADAAQPDPADMEAVTEAAVEAVAEAADLGEEPEPVLTGPVVRVVRVSRRIRSIGALRNALSRAARRGAQVSGKSAASSGRWLADQVLSIAPRLPVRDLRTLRAQYPGRDPEQLADALIEGAARSTAAVGAAVGAWAILPMLPAAGVEITTETLAVVGIEIKLVAELHEVYGMPARGGRIERMTSYVGSWAQRRGVSLMPGGLIIAAGSPIARQLRRRLAARAGRSAFSLGPLLTGAIAGGLINRRETRKLGRILQDDLRKRSASPTAWPD